MQNLMDVEVLTALEAEYGQILTLCDKLEAIADSLPFNLDPSLMEGVAHALLPSLDKTCSLEEQALFPVLAESGAIYVPGPMIERLRSEHRRDRIAAEEVAKMLDRLVQGRVAQHWETIGYMLRAFFSGMRRHIEAERQLIGELSTRRQLH